MEKRALQLASVASMIDQFNIPNILILQSLGYKVDVVADFTNPGTITKERADNLKKRLSDLNVRVFDIAIPRSLNPAKILSAYKEIEKLINEESYDILHCHSPIGGVLARKAAKKKRKNGLKVIYTAHGFHFYKSAPIKNWMIFYPIEKHYSRYTDVLITINKEDFDIANRKFYASKTVYVPGIGIDRDRFKQNSTSRYKIRNELGIKDNQIMLLSVGELNTNKNHETVIKSLTEMDLVYVIVGKGTLEDHLKQTARDKNVDLRLMGFRTDVSDFYCAADIYILPSIREGLNVSLMEAMASSLPCIVSRIRGNVDLITEPAFLFNPLSEVEIRNSILNILSQDREKIGIQNLQTIGSFDLSSVEKKMLEIYKE